MAAPTVDSRQFIFGPGLAWALLASYLDTGVAPTTPFPVRFDVTQSVSVDFTMSEKELYGQQVFPTAIGIGQGKVTGKVVNGRFNSRLIQSAFYGASNSTTASSSYMMAEDVAGTIPSVTPLTLTPTVPGSGTWYKDWGVRWAVGGTYLTPVASGPTTGQYSVSSGVYTFAAADEGQAVLFDFEYSLTSGYTFEISNFLQGQITLFGFRYAGQYQGRLCGMWVPNAVGTKMTFNTKQQEFVLPEWDFMGFAGPSGQVANLYLQE
jgi:hypothetical protein